MQNGIVDEDSYDPCTEDDLKVVHDGHKHGFITAAIRAFAEHWPLAIRPQHLWLMILQGVAVHVNDKSKELSQKWVKANSAKELVVVANNLVLGGKNNDWASIVNGTDPYCFTN